MSSYRQKTNKRTSQECLSSFLETFDLGINDTFIISNVHSTYNILIYLSAKMSAFG
jgi:hypothetical protein